VAEIVSTQLLNTGTQLRHPTSDPIVTPDQFAVEWIAVDDQFIYWAEEVFGAIKRAPK
jgi:hypothetical protein